MVLAALAACHEVTYRLYADALGIPLDEASVSVTGHSDARGFSGSTIRYLQGSQKLLAGLRSNHRLRIRKSADFSSQPADTAPYSTI
ncbi:MAG TPA: hypothetical protein DG761_03415 [Gammaproteobacteria bacterium]|nr:hypothetical protein [Acidiferrobacteraceae bacterium]HCX87050.1 hypothetical protein [Gammaproteobacteria bacterium]